MNKRKLRKLRKKRLKELKVIYNTTKSKKKKKICIELINFLENELKRKKKFWFF